MNKTYVYIGDSNCYHMMKIAAKSLLTHTHVDKIYMLTDDEKFPCRLPDIIECINVHGQEYFPDGSINNRSFYSYMTLMRSVLSKILTEKKVVLLDPDTLVYGSLEKMWETELEDYYFAAVRETRNSTHERSPYYNAGVMLMNLEKFRNDKMDDDIIDALNNKWYLHLEQDALNELCENHIIDLPSCYSASFVTNETKKPLIRHYLSYDKRMFMRNAKEYVTMSWDKVMEKQKQIKEEGDVYGCDCS